jgi:hypothetical protein
MTVLGELSVVDLSHTFGIQNGRFAMRGEVATFVLVLTLLAPAQAVPATILSGTEVHQAVVGKTLASKTHRGIPYTMHLDQGGTGVFVYRGSTQDALTWDITGNVLCFHSKMSGTECNTVRASGGGYDFVDSTTGALNNTYTAP